MSTKHELLRLEKQYWDAIQHKDAAAASALSDDACIVVGAQGVGKLSREQLEQMMKQASYELTSYELVSVEQRITGAERRTRNCELNAGRVAGLSLGSRGSQLVARRPSSSLVVGARRSLLCVQSSSLVVQSSLFVK